MVRQAAAFAIKSFFALVVAALIYLFCWPIGTPLEAWVAPAETPLPTLTTLTGQVLAEGVCGAPGHVAVDAAGRVYAACSDEHVVMLNGNAGSYSTFAAEVEGTQAIAFSPVGGLAIAAGANGLLHVGGKPKPTVLLSTANDPALRYLAGVDSYNLVRSVLFTNASDRPHRADPMVSLVEHAGRGSLYRYDLQTKAATRLLDGLQTPLAVAMGPNDAYALIAETGSYRILRYWLAGERAGTSEVFADHLPGFVTSLTSNGNGRYWAAFAQARNRAFDKWTQRPSLRRVLARMPWSHVWRWLPIKDDSFAMAFDTNGQVTAAFRLAPDPAIGRITSVAEHGPWLWIGSDRGNAIVRTPLNVLIPSVAPPKPGWQSATRKPDARNIKAADDDD